MKFQWDSGEILSERAKTQETHKQIITQPSHVGLIRKGPGVKHNNILKGAFAAASAAVDAGAMKVKDQMQTKGT